MELVSLERAEGEATRFMAAFLGMRPSAVSPATESPVRALVGWPPAMPRGALQVAHGRWGQDSR